MHRHSLFAALVAFCLAIATPLFAQVAQDDRDGGDGSGILDLLPADAVTEHALKRPSGDLAYVATAGTLDLRDQSGRISAKVFYTAYVAKDAPVVRPITFAFNGGPGAASAYLHLGLVGPRVLEFDARNRDGTKPALSDNPDSWLDFTDLVLIDPVGTGWSRASGKEAEAGFYGVRQDAESLAKAIALYAQEAGRMASPKFLLGESYGGFRAAKVATALQEGQGIVVSGIVMLSPLIEGSLIFGSDDPLDAALQLPSLAAAALERKGAFSEEAVAAAERFAMNDYLVSLAGPSPTGEEAERFYARVAALTGIEKAEVTRARGFVGDIYTKSIAGAPGKVASPYDAAFLVDDPYPETAADRGGADPILDGFTRAYGAAFPAYARDELRFSTSLTYRLLDKEVNRRWDWSGSRSQVTATSELRELLSVVPSFRLLVAHGYSDALTPYGASRYVIDHLPPSLVANRAILKVYRGGHMFYTDPDERRKLTDDARAFYAGRDKD